MIFRWNAQVWRPILAIAIAALALGSVAAPAHAAGSGTIVGVASGDPAAGWDNDVTIVTVRTLTNQFVISQVFTSGYSVTVPAGEYKLLFSYHGDDNFAGTYYGGVSPQTIVVAEGSVVTADVVMPVGAQVSGTVSGAFGPLETANIRSTRVGSGLSYVPRVVFDAQTGGYKIDRIPPGTQRLTYASPDHVTQVVETTFTAGETRTDVDIVLNPTTTIEGQILVADTPYYAAGTTATLYEDGTAIAAVRESGGRFSFTVEPGTYSICFSDENPPRPNQVVEDQFVAECWEDSDRDSPTLITVALGEHRTEIIGKIDMNVTIYGFVTGSFGGQPFELTGFDAELFMRNPSTGTFESVLTSTEIEWTQYSFQNVPRGDYIVRVSDGSRAWFEPRFYPGVESIDDAEIITIDSNMEGNLATLNLVGAQVTSTRLEGESRFETGVAISQAQFPGAPHADGPVPVLYIANGLNYPDALSATPAAIVQGGGLLLVRPDSIPAAVIDEIVRLDPDRIVVVGSSGSVSSGVFEQLEEYADSVERIGGSDRYETSALIVDAAFGELDVEKVLIATGRDFPDALAAGPAAGVNGYPVLLVNGTSDDLDASTSDVIADLGPDQIIILGSTASVTDSIGYWARIAASSGAGHQVESERIGGLNRYDTAAQINSQLLPGNRPDAVIATGATFADALGGGVYAGSIGAPLYLSQRTCVEQNVIRTLLAAGIRQVVLVGGTPSLDEDVAGLTPCS